MGAPNPLTAEDLLEGALMGVGSQVGGGVGMVVEEANPPGGVLKVVHSLLEHSGDDQYRRGVYAYHLQNNKKWREGTTGQERKYLRNPLAEEYVVPKVFSSRMPPVRRSSCMSIGTKVWGLFSFLHGKATRNDIFTIRTNQIRS